jgi:hypothetical protein
MLATCFPPARSNVLLGELDAFHRIGQRHHKAVRTHAHQQAVDNRQGQRQAQADGRPGARLAGDIDAPAQRLHIAAHHVHPNAAPRHIGDLARGRKARR